MRNNLENINSMKKIIYIALTIIWMIIIFLFSAAPAAESTEMSRSAGHVVGQMIVPGYEDWDQERQDAFAEKIDYPVRKCAHASEYAVLGILLFLTIREYVLGAQLAGGTLRGGDGMDRANETRGIRGRRRSAKYALAASILYAASDEFHQLFVPGRSGRVTDVMIDTAGALIGILLIYMVMKKRDSRKEKQKPFK